MLPEHYEEGRCARFDGRQCTANPHRRGTPAARQWAEGWDDAQQELGGAARQQPEGPAPAPLSPLVPNNLLATGIEAVAKAVRDGKDVNGKPITAAEIARCLRGLADVALGRRPVDEEEQP
jgi:hypothetical protein